MKAMLLTADLPILEGTFQSWDYLQYSRTTSEHQPDYEYICELSSPNNLIDQIRSYVIHNIGQIICTWIKKLKSDKN